jgi:tetratricopeptide (TPR) repeat protein
VCKIFSDLEDEESLVNAIQYLAFINYEEGMLTQAREAWQRVVDLNLRLAQWEDVSESTYFLAKILEDLKEFSEAAYYLKLSIQVYTRADLGLGLRYLSLGHIYTLQQDYATSYASLKKAAELIEKSGDEQKLGEAYEKIALCLEQLGEMKEAEEYRMKSKTCLKSHQVISYSTSQRLAEYFEDRRSYLDALRYYWQSLKIARELGIETLEIEKAIQRISKKVRKKSEGK